MPAFDDLLADQAGVVARRQLLDLSYEPHDIRRMQRRKELAPLFPGVYVSHTGDPTWIQRAWGAVLYAWPAALAGESAIRAAERVGLDSTAASVIEIAIDHARTVRDRDGIAVSRSTPFDLRVQWNVSPPRLRYEEAVLDRAAECGDDLDAVATLTRACASRRTTADRLLEAMQKRTRVRRRAWLRGVLGDIRDGTHSVLEHGYLHRVERPHGLPSPRRQLQGTGGEGATVFRDADLGILVIELDGRIHHESAERRDADLDRDLDVLIEGRPTARLGWGQVLRRPCRTAVKLATLLHGLGWDGAPRPCSAPGCAVAGCGEIRATT